jgi:hypothetical protein
VANAGNNQSVSIGSVVTFDGTNSTDANRDSLTYKWTFGSITYGSSPALSSHKSPNPKFTADVAGTYSVILMVNDGKVESTASVVTITASASNSAPVANAGLSQNVPLSTTVTLDGTGSSDANNDFLTSKCGLTQSIVDRRLFYKSGPGGQLLLVCVYVDDNMIVANDQAVLDQFEAAFNARFPDSLASGLAADISSDITGVKYERSSRVLELSCIKLLTELKSNLAALPSDWTQPATVRTATSMR